VTRGVYGSQQVQAELRLGQHIRFSRRGVHRLMCGSGLRTGDDQARAPRFGRPGARVVDDLVERKFRSSEPKVLWVADPTYLAMSSSLFSIH
jgi:hypothetical protein